MNYYKEIVLFSLIKNSDKIEFYVLNKICEDIIKKSNYNNYIDDNFSFKIKNVIYYHLQEDDKYINFDNLIKDLISLKFKTPSQVEEEIDKYMIDYNNNVDKLKSMITKQLFIKNNIIKNICDHDKNFIEKSTEIDDGMYRETLKFKECKRCGYIHYL